MASRRLSIPLLLVVALAAGVGCSEQQPPAPLPPGSGCTQNSECASGICEAGACVDPNNPPDGGAPDGGGDQPPACLQPGTECTAGETPCCTGLCFSRNGDAPICGNEPVCKTFGESCSGPDDCCSRTCLGTGKCGEQCKAIGTACSTAGECCTGACNGTCQALTDGTLGKTIGEPCTTASQCASGNCQEGFCFDASWCRANGDLCYESAKCCSGLCSKTDGTPGVCLAWSAGGIGNLKTAGMPCLSNANCYSQLCLDVGLGAKVCVLASGCREKGELCLKNGDCCAYGFTGNDDACEMGSNGIGQCGNAGGNAPVGECCKRDGTSGSNCQNGSSCLYSVSADSCRQDSTGAYRCFGGGQPQADGGVNQTLCERGYDGTDPNCCIASGNPCQFRDQCCNLQPCLWDDSKARFVCAQPTCVAAGSACDPAVSGEGACCSGLSCIRMGEVGTPICRVPPSLDAGTPSTPDGGVEPGTDGGQPDAGPTCYANDTACTSGSECCSGTCLQTTGKCAPVCLSDSAACVAGSDCCSGNCVTVDSNGNKQCKTYVCVNDGQACSGSADCCSGTCQVPPGASVGTCATVTTCSGPYEACSPTQGCCTGLRCLNTTGTTCQSGDPSCACKFGIN